MLMVCQKSTSTLCQVLYARYFCSDSANVVISSLHKNLHKSKRYVPKSKEDLCSEPVFVNMIDFFQKESPPEMKKVDLSIFKKRNMEHYRASVYGKDTLNKFDSDILKLSKDQKLYQAYLKIKDCQDNELPKFYLLRVVAAFASENLSPEDVLILKKKAKSCCRDLYENEYKFNHYLGRSLVKNGQVERGLQHFLSCFAHYSSSQKLRDLLCPSLLFTNEAHDTTIIKVLHVIDHYASYEDYVPAFVVWSSLFLSKLHKHNKMAAELLDKHPKILQCKESYLADVINGLFRHPSPEEMIVKISQIFLKYDMLDELTETLSKAIIYYCSRRDGRNIDAIIKFAKEFKVQLTTNSLKFYQSFIYNPDIDSIMDKKFQLTPVIKFKTGA